MLHAWLTDLPGELHIWLPTEAGPQEADLTDIQGTFDMHLFAQPNPRGRMWANVPPPAVRDDARDAARYRFLRNNPHFNADKGRLEWYLPRWFMNTGTRAERLDEAIDQEMKGIPG